MIECVMEALTDASPEVQRVAADCFLEFFKWFDKRADDDADADGASSGASGASSGAKMLLKMISAYARHPDVARRFAAAKAFNKIYHVFRENSDLGEFFLFLPSFLSFPFFFSFFSFLLSFFSFPFFSFLRSFPRTEGEAEGLNLQF